MTATTRGSPMGGNESQEQGQAPDGQSQPPLPQNQVSATLPATLLHVLLLRTFLTLAAVAACLYDILFPKIS